MLANGVEIDATWPTMRLNSSCTLVTYAAEVGPTSELAYRTESTLAGEENTRSIQWPTWGASSPWIHHPVPTRPSKAIEQVPSLGGAAYTAPVDESRSLSHVESTPAQPRSSSDIRPPLLSSALAYLGSLSSVEVASW